MSNIAIRHRRGSTVALSTVVMKLGDVFVDTTKSSVIVGDGTTAGGVPLAHEVHTHPNATTGTAGFMSSTDKTKLNALSSAGGIQNILANTSALPNEPTINFTTNFAVVDNSGATRTDVDISTTFINQIHSDTVALILALG